MGFANCYKTRPPASSGRRTGRCRCPVPAEARVLLAEDRVPPAELRILSAEDHVLPAEVCAVPEEDRVVPAEVRVVPAEVRTIPAEERLLPAENRVLLAEVPVVPEGNGRVPAELGTIPAEDHAPPAKLPVFPAMLSFLAPGVASWRVEPQRGSVMQPMGAEPWRALERPGSGDGERKTLLTRQIAFEPLPASVLFALADS
jgi:hypothetical protein